jgi:hypothetical protein
MPWYPRARDERVADPRREGNRIDHSIGLARPFDQIDVERRLRVLLDEILQLSDVLRRSSHAWQPDDRGVAEEDLGETIRR